MLENTYHDVARHALPQLFFLCQPEHVLRPERATELHLLDEVKRHVRCDSTPANRHHEVSLNQENTEYNQYYLQ